VWFTCAEEWIGFLMRLFGVKLEMDSPPPQARSEKSKQAYPYASVQSPRSPFDTELDEYMYQSSVSTMIMACWLSSRQCHFKRLNKLYPE
jgi:hypothetical protein